MFSRALQPKIPHGSVQAVVSTTGETLSWAYLCYVREHPVTWTVPTHILYGEKDNLTSYETIAEFADRIGATLTAVSYTHLVEYVRNFMKRVRKKDSAVIIASQNLEDFNLDGVREYTKPLFSIPTHQFLFNAGSIDAKFYTDTLQLEDSEYNLIRYPQRGVCLYKCGNERYNLMVNAPEHKARLFGKAGGR